MNEIWSLRKASANVTGGMARTAEFEREQVDSTEDDCQMSQDCPSHQETFDIKPEALGEVRGEFQPVNTCVSGSKISKHLPILAKAADKYAIARGITHNVADQGIEKQSLLTGHCLSCPSENTMGRTPAEVGIYSKCLRQEIHG
jgi:hypothetical protein